MGDAVLQVDKINHQARVLVAGVPAVPARPGSSCRPPRIQYWQQAAGKLTQLIRVYGLSACLYRLQVASRMATAFTTFKNYDAERQVSTPAAAGAAPPHCRWPRVPLHHNAAAAVLCLPRLTVLVFTLGRPLIRPGASIC
jgi:hypothetical protein